MTVPATPIGPWIYNGDGSSTEFEYGGKIFDATDLLVYVDGLLVTSGYSVTNVGVAGGGNVVFTTAPAVGAANVVIERAIPANQQIDLKQFGQLPAESLEKASDKLTILIQQLLVDMSRTIRLAAGATATFDPIADLAGLAGKILGFDSSSNPIGVEPTDSSSEAVTAAGTPVSRLLADWFADVINLKSEGAVGDGATDDRAAFVAAQTDAGDGKWIMLPDGTYLINSDLTITSGLWFGRGKIKPANGVTVTIGGPIQAASAEIFDLSAGGTVTIGEYAPIEELNGAWWGMFGDDSTVNTTPFQQLLNAMVASKLPGFVPAGIFYFNSETCYWNSDGTASGVGITNGKLRGAGRANGSSGDNGTELKNIGFIVGNGDPTSASLPDSEAIIVRDMQIRGYLACHGIQQGWGLQNVRIVPRSPATTEGLYLVDCLVTLFYNVRVDFGGGSGFNGVFAESCNKWQWFGGGVSNNALGLSSGERNQSGGSFDWQFHGLYFEDNETNALNIRMLKNGVFRIAASGNTDSDWTPSGNPLVVLGNAADADDDLSNIDLTHSYFRANPTGGAIANSVAINAVRGTNIDLRFNQFIRIETCVDVDANVVGYLVGGDTNDGTETNAYTIDSSATPMIQHGPWRFDFAKGAELFQVIMASGAGRNLGTWMKSNGQEWGDIGFDDSNRLRVRAHNGAGGAIGAALQVDGAGGASEFITGTLKFKLESYTVATLPSAATAGQLIYVSDGTGNKRLAVSNGSNWRFPDGAIVS